MITINLKVSRDFAERLVVALDLVGEDEEFFAEVWTGQIGETVKQFKKYLNDQLGADE